MRETIALNVATLSGSRRHELLRGVEPMRLLRESSCCTGWSRNPFGVEQESCEWEMLGANMSKKSGLGTSAPSQKKVIPTDSLSVDNGNEIGGPAWGEGKISSEDLARGEGTTWLLQSPWNSLSSTYLLRSPWNTPPMETTSKQSSFSVADNARISGEFTSQISTRRISWFDTRTGRPKEVAQPSHFLKVAKV